MWCFTCYDTDYKAKKADKKNPDRARVFRDMSGGPCVVCEKVISSSWLDDRGVVLQRGRAGRQHVMGRILCLGCWNRKAEVGREGQQPDHGGKTRSAQQEDEETDDPASYNHPPSRKMSSVQPDYSALTVATSTTVPATKRPTSRETAPTRSGPCYECKTVLSTRWMHSLRGEEEHQEGRMWCANCYSSDRLNKKQDEANPNRKRLNRDFAGGPCCVCEKIKSASWMYPALQMDERGSRPAGGPIPMGQAAGKVWCQGCWKRRQVEGDGDVEMA